VSGPEAEALILKLFAGERFPKLLRKESDLLAKKGTRSSLPEIFRQIHSENPHRASFARTIRKEIITREKIEIDELMEIEAEVARDLPKREPVQKNTPTLKTRPLGSGIYRHPVKREVERATPRRIWWILGTGAAAIALAVVAFIALPGTDSVGDIAPPLFETSGIVRASRARYPGEVAGQAVSFSGAVKVVSPKDGMVLLSTYNRLVSVRLNEKIRGPFDWQALRPGRVVLVRGTITTKTLLGGVFVDASALEVGR
jgi:hypothetical protein